MPALAQDTAPNKPADATTELAVEGMTCASCVAHVTRALAEVPGVADVQVNLATERARVDHAAAISAQDLIAAVRHAGYGAAPAPAGDSFHDVDAQRRDAELLRKRRLLVFAIVLFVPAMIVGMAVPDFANKDWVMFALTVPVWAIVGWSFHRGAIVKAMHGAANMDTLVSLGSSAAMAYSIYATIAMRPAYYETASAIVTLIFLGKYLETAAKGKSNSAIRALLHLRPDIARIRDRDGAVREVPSDAVEVGDEVLVPPGERLPVDGIVLQGRSAVNVSALTGESLPQEVEPGMAVRTGTINGDGAVVVRASAVGANTTLAHIIEIVRHAQGSTPPVQRLADRVAGVFVPVILAITAVTFAAWLLSGHAWSVALPVAVAVLVVACPCALGLATPMAVIVGVGLGAKHGMLFKDAEALEKLRSVGAVVFDKTGTLTQGHPQVARVTGCTQRVDENAVLAIAAALERNSSHPLAGAVVRAAQPLAAIAATDVNAVRGKGLTGTVLGKPAVAGNADFVADAGVSVPPALRDSSDSTAIFVAHGGELIGVIAVHDAARAGAAEGIAALASLGVESYVVSGDAQSPVRMLAERIGIPLANATAQMLPEDKAHFVRELQSTGRQVAFVGDGINDAPALATADVGIAMGGGTDVAMETAKAAIVSNDPAAVASAILLSRATMRTIRMNLFWAFAYNVVLIPLAALGIVHPIFAAAAMGMSSLFVVGNSLLLRRRI